jgi:hypothetical protein
LDSKLNYNRYKTTDDRGYNILNFNNNYQHYKNTVRVKNDKDEWEKIVDKAGDKGTFQIKGIYKDHYDFTDCEQGAHSYKVNRQSKNI